MQKKISVKGFSLTELSIVLIIMGLIIAAVISGASFVNYAKVRALIAHADEHQSHMYGFLAKYNEYPGDFTEATIYWNAASPEDGDGDGNIMFLNGSGVQEGYNAWQHLALAGMAERDFPGSGGGLNNPVAHTHIPGAVYKGSAFFWANDVVGHDDKNVLVVGKPIENTSGSLLLNGILIQEVARNIDLKADDGNPSEGSVKAVAGADMSAGDCVDNNGTASDVSDDGYNTESESFACILGFMSSSQ